MRAKFTLSSRNSLKEKLLALTKAQAYQSEFYLSMNYETKRNLELTTTIRANQNMGHCSGS